jgi:hypothetical protein
MNDGDSVLLDASWYRRLVLPNNASAQLQFWTTELDGCSDSEGMPWAPTVTLDGLIQNSMDESLQRSNNNGDQIVWFYYRVNVIRN